MPKELAGVSPDDWSPQVPLVRITTCGQLTIEVLHALSRAPDGSLHAVYGPPDQKLLTEKGTSTAFILLPLLTSQPNTFALKDFLSEKLRHLPAGGEEWDEDTLEDEGGLKRVDNVVSRLRHLLSPPWLNDLPTAKALRRRLVTFHRASAESGPGYRLAGAPLVWLDVEVMRHAAKRARTLEQFGNDGLAEWRDAYDLASRGLFLPQEAYSDWVCWRRQEVEAHLWEGVQVLWRHSLEQREAGEVEGEPPPD